ncbi:MAG: SDR family oxidoreductase [Betaproteobacteria bacterium]|nr:SDR family oxidoreductase [Betaproteobacteria bacterium]
MTACLITGASGFVGRALWTALRGRGFTARAAMRLYSAVEFPPGAEGTEVVRTGDIGSATDWTAALRGCEAVVHLAARVHIMRESGGDAREAFFRTNVEGSENLARQAARAGVRRFVFLSSVKVNGEITRERAFTESDPPAPTDAYGASKAQAEERLKKIADETGMEVVILRPPLVYGPGVKANFLGLLRAVDSGLPLPLSSISNLRSLVYVGNLVHALEACLVHPAAANRTFFVADDHDVSTPQLVREIAAALGKEALLFPISPVLLRGIGALTGRTEQIARLTGSLRVDVSSIKKALGWQPPFSLQQGLARTVSWYRTRSG